MNEMDEQIAGAVSETVSTLPVKTIVVAFVAGAAAAAATAGATYLTRQYLKAKKLAKENAIEANPSSN